MHPEASQSFHYRLLIDVESPANLLMKYKLVKSLTGLEISKLKKLASLRCK